MAEFVYFVYILQLISMTDIIDSLLNRRTIRKYRSEAVSDDLLNDLLNAGCRSSTTGNMQVYSIIVTREESFKRELSPLHFNQKMVAEAPVLLTFCADFNRFNKWCRLRNAEPGYDNFLSFMTAAIDACLLLRRSALRRKQEVWGNSLSWQNHQTSHKIIEVLKLPKELSL